MPGRSFLPYRRLLDHPPPRDPLDLRVTALREENPRGDVVLYWMRAARRAKHNLALLFAEREAARRTLPLRVVETPDPSPSPRAQEFVRSAPRHWTYSKELPVDRARIVVTDEFPTLETPPFVTHLVDGNGILPMRLFEKEQYSAKFLRDRAHRAFSEWWVPVSGDPHPRVREFVEQRLHGYAEGRNRSPLHVSGLSPWLHFGHVGIHELATAILRSDAPQADIDAFLEEAIIRRELSFNLCFFNRDYASLRALPQWAHRTLDAHRSDRRKPQYSFEELERAATHDDVWNLAQRQLLACGTIHGYLRMLWGKKIIEWSATPEAAHAAMVRLHDLYALDGLDPNTYAGILWCFGKHDRPWFPERPIFGSIRYMSSESASRKVRLREVEAAVTACEASAGIPAGS